ncbi:shikimate kinase [Acanthopleuribacter pedis]|uniref:Shikimate kinase n=1 Tax=Acanthopleuribacter pedis TaxID=442870 RepID=A0A8J7Q8R6_9BACT|nr:shikimate kinase [Acanthopleuribacter pedis]MBO1319995.1 shikimate kinase [Acanthopleuribacter pedis]
MQGNPSLNKAVYLTGFMGAGKTSVGICLATHLALPFVDLDARIEAAEQCSIASLFSAHGEPWFRALEVRTLQALTTPAVVALGGGAFIQEPIRALIASRGGLSVFLDPPFSVLYARIAGDPNRPLSRSRTQLETLYQSRLPVYRLADVVWVPGEAETPAVTGARLAAVLKCCVRGSAD